MKLPERSFVESLVVSSLSVVELLLTKPEPELGRYAYVSSVGDLIDSWCEADWNCVRVYPECESKLYTLTSGPVGSVKSIGKRKLEVMTDRGDLTPDIGVKLHYAHGNIYTYVLRDDLKPNSLLSNVTGVLVSSDGLNVLQACIGGFTRPNDLYLQSQLDGRNVKLISAIKHPDVHCLSILETDPRVLVDCPTYTL